jgi:hypothetical protein
VQIPVDLQFEGAGVGPPIEPALVTGPRTCSVRGGAACAPSTAPAAVTWTLVHVATPATVTGPAITTSSAAPGTTPPIQVDSSNQGPPAAVDRHSGCAGGEDDDSQDGPRQSDRTDS